jgi:AraC family transcriptional regulator
VHGDIDIVPRHTPARWKLVGDADRSILLSLPYGLLHSAAAAQSELPIELLNRFQVRDPVLETLATAAAREIEDGHPSGEAYLDGIGLAAASRLMACHRSEEHLSDPLHEALTGHRLKGVLSYIEDRLGTDLALSEIAGSVGLSSSHLTSLFRKTMGITVHQHVVKRRVERAKALLQDSTLSIAEIALAVGFAHQSHMARHMGRILGFRPRDLKRRERSGS